MEQFLLNFGHLGWNKWYDALEKLVKEKGPFLILPGEILKNSNTWLTACLKFVSTPIIYHLIYRLGLSA